MKKLLMLPLMIAFFAVTANAQSSNIKFSVGGGISSYSFSGGSSSVTGFGIDVNATKSLNEQFEGFFQTGYNSYSKNGFTVGYIPFLFGANFKLGSIKPGLGIGYGRFSSGSNSTGGFSFSPQVGYAVDKFNFIAHYTSTSIENGASINILGIKVLYNLK